MNSSIYGEKLNHRDRLAEGFRPLVAFDGAESSSDTMLSSLLEYVITAACEIFGASSASLMLLDGNQQLVARASTGISPEIIRAARRKLGEGISGWVAKNVKPLLLSGPINDPRFQGIDPTINCALCVPLVARDKTIGVLNLNTRKPETTFSHRDLDMASLVAVALATAIETSFVEKQVEEDSKQAFMLFELGRALNGASDEQDILDITARVLRDFTGADFCSVLELQDDNWVLRAADGLDRAIETKTEFVGKVDGCLDRSLTQGSVSFVNRDELGHEEMDWIPSDIANLLVVPLSPSKRISGVILSGRQGDRPFDTGLLSYLSSLSAQVTAAWDMAKETKAREEEIASKERHRIAQELHDSLAQELSGLVLAIESCQLSLDRGQNVIPGQLAKATRIARGCLSDVRQYMTLLRSNRDEPTSFPTLFEKLVEDFRRQTGMPVDFSVDSTEKKLATDVQLAFLRIAQEALINIRKHANATSIKLQFVCEDGEGRLLVADNGVGFDVQDVTERGPIEGKYGLLGMRERATSVGGVLDIISGPGIGTQTSLRIPLAPGHPNRGR